MSGEEQPKSWPPSRHAYEELQRRDLLHYGAMLPWPLLEGLIDQGPVDAWPFKSSLIDLQRRLKEDGFLTTQAGTNGAGLRVMTREEMADAVRRKEYGKANDSLRNSLMLSQVPREDLEDGVVKGIDHWETKTAILGATAKVLLRKKNLPAPEMTIKSIKQAAKEEPGE